MDQLSIFIIPRSSTAWRGNEAGWITSAGWAAAGAKLFGKALVATTDGVFSPDEARTFPREKLGPVKRAKVNHFRHLIPEIIITAIKDLNLYLSKPKQWPIENHVLLSSKKIGCVWERHDLFSGPGHKIARMYNAPFIISVEALTVWEARKWGVKRPVWGWLLEKFVEARSLKRANFVICVSDEVRKKVIQLGVSSDKILVCPNGVDTSLFNTYINGKQVKETLQLESKRVIGWTGSFRKFHGLSDLIDAFKIINDKFTDTVLILVGSGQEFDNIKLRIKNLGLRKSVVLTGRQSFSMIPQFICNFNIGIVSASSSEGFHYSPLKLREYMAVGCPVIAPRIGDLPDQFEDEVDLLFYEPGNVSDLAKKLETLLIDEALGHSLSKKGLLSIEQNGTWVHEFVKVCNKLNISV